MRLPAEPGPHRIWAGDLLLNRAALFDGESGELRGMLAGGRSLMAAPLFLPGREAILFVETHYSRTVRGERTDVVVWYDPRTLEPQHEVEIPPKRAEHLNGVGGAALTDDGRFLAVYNRLVGSSLSIVDVRERRFVGEIATAGCGLVYPMGPRALLSLCGDGTAQVIRLDDAGREAARLRSEPFFDPQSDPLKEDGVRPEAGRWLFVSYEGRVHAVTLGAEGIRSEEPWPLFAESEREAGWRVGGLQHLALHGPSGRLFVAVLQGGPHDHKSPGTEVWVYDLGREERVSRIELRSPEALFLRELLGAGAAGAEEAGLGSRLLGWLLEWVLPNSGAERIAVSQDAEPVLFAASGFPSTLAVYDAASGAFERAVPEVGIATTVLVVPGEDAP